MRLSQFIHDTLFEIALGVHLAQARSAEIAAVSPEDIDGQRVAERTYIDFDVAVVVGETDTKTKAGEGRIGGEIQVASVIKASAGMDANAETASTASTQQTHRVAFNVPIYMNAHFRDNPKAVAEHKRLLSAHGLDAKTEQTEST